MIIVTAKIGLLRSEIGKKRVYIPDKQLASATEVGCAPDAWCTGGGFLFRLFHIDLGQRTE